jgi:hypothetical protein
MLLVSANTAFGFSDEKTLWEISWQKLNWLIMEYNEMHRAASEKQADPEKEHENELKQIFKQFEKR